MKFWQPQYKEDIISINYSETIHRSNEKKIKELILRLDNYDFNLDFNIELYRRQCKYCDFTCDSMYVMHLCRNIFSIRIKTRKNIPSLYTYLNFLMLHCLK